MPGEGARQIERSLEARYLPGLDMDQQQDVNHRHSPRTLSLV
jgi:hypothetical protein